MANPFKAFGKFQLLLFWLCILAILTMVFGNWQQNKINPNRTVISSSSNGSNQVILKRNSNHQYLANGSINGHKVTFLVDTGATDVAMSSAVAKKAKLSKGFKGYAGTAGGIVKSYKSNIKRLQLGNIELFNIEATIIPTMSDGYVLLGMSALKQLELVHKEGKLIINY